MVAAELPAYLLPPHWFFEISEGSGIAIGIAFGATGWLVKSIISWMAWTYRRKVEEKELVEALWSEVSSNLKYEKAYARPALRISTIRKLRRYRKSGHQLKLAAPSFDENVVFNQIKSNITRLPSGCLPAIVNYYNVSNALSALSAFLVTDEFSAMPLARQGAFLIEVETLAGEVVSSGEKALLSLHKEVDRFEKSENAAIACSFVFAAGALDVAARLLV